MIIKCTKSRFRIIGKKHFQAPGLKEQTKKMRLLYNKLGKILLDEVIRTAGSYGTNDSVDEYMFETLGKGDYAYLEITLFHPELEEEENKKLWNH